MNIETFLNSKEHLPTSTYDLMKAIDTNIVNHFNLKKYKSIDDVLKNDSAIIFFGDGIGIGHWCGLTKRGNLIEFFDPYGRPPNYKRYLHSQPSYLYNLLKKSKYDVRYNNIKFQGGGSSTCGRHVILRIALKNAPLSEYKKFIDNRRDLGNMSIDKFVTFLTGYI